jgi:hypothetical protein
MTPDEAFARTPGPAELDANPGVARGGFGEYWPGSC